MVSHTLNRPRLGKRCSRDRSIEVMGQQAGYAAVRNHAK